MYRQYENPYRLEDELRVAKEQLARRLAGGSGDDCWDLYETVAELEERVNFAWQDDEYDASGDWW